MAVSHTTLACVIGVRKGRGREFGRETARKREGPEIPFPSLSDACLAI